MLYALLAISIVMLIAIVILFVIVIRSKPQQIDSGINDKDLGELKGQINSLKESLQKVNKKG